jgi:hypothetical protein
MECTFLSRRHISFYGAILVVGAVRILFPERSLVEPGPRALLDSGFALSLLIFVLILSNGLGQKLFCWAVPSNTLKSEQLVYGTTLGLGLLASGVFFLGLLGLFNLWALVIWLLVIAFVVGVDLGKEVAKIYDEALNLFGRLRSENFLRKFFTLIIATISTLSIFQCLTPPWDYDGLMYHLQGPKLFLQAGKMVLLPDLWQANGANLVDMLYLVGLALESDSFAKLINLAFAILLLIAVFSFGRRYLNPPGGALAAVLLLGVPVYGIWASWAYSDYSWAIFEFLSLTSLLAWVEKRNWKLLILSSILMGFALGSKYLALESLVIFAGLVFWFGGKDGFRNALVRATIFAGIALLIGTPWYIKNLVLSGNPLYPFVFGGPGWDKQRLDLLMGFLSSFGTGKALVDFILLPINLFRQNMRFAGFMGAIEFPNPMFMFLPLYLWTRSFETRNTRVLDILAWVVLFRIVLWSLGSQQTRFLLPVFPMISILVAAVLVQLSQRNFSPKIGESFLVGLMAINLGMALFTSSLYYKISDPLPVVFGGESKDTFLRGNLTGYTAIQFINSDLSPSDRVLMLWDGRGYYCSDRCLPDSEQSQWVRFYLETPDLRPFVQRLKDKGITHILISLSDAKFVEDHDPRGQHRQAIQFLENEFIPVCTNLAFSDEWSQLYRIDC